MGAAAPVRETEDSTGFGMSFGYGSRSSEVAMPKYGLNKHEVADLREVFEIFDSNCSGFIEPRELKVMMQNLGMSVVDDSEADKLFNDLDLNCDGKINFEEFVAMMTREGSADEEVPQGSTGADAPTHVDQYMYGAMGISVIIGVASIAVFGFPANVP